MDLNLLLAIHDGWSHPALDVLFAWLSQTLWFSTPLLFVMLALWWRAHGRDGAWLWLALVAVSIIGDQLGGLLKFLSAQARPCAEMPELIQVPRTWFHIACSKSLNGLPSNHAWNFFAAAVFAGVTLRSRAWFVALATIAAAVSLSRVYLGVHYPSQVAVGAVLGALYGLLAARLALHYLPFAQRIAAKKNE